jgi:alkylhydroperoxidase/carboxymuconolactone decarboxylase family protein YurZ
MLAIAPGLAGYTDAVLFGEIWKRPALAARDRSIVTVAALITNGDAVQLGAHVLRALDNGVTPRELSEIITHLAFYAGWPKAVTAIGIVKGVFEQRGIKPEEIAANGSPASALTQDAAKDHDVINGSDARDAAPALAAYTSRLIFGNLWCRPGFSARDRSLVTIAALIAEGQTDQLVFYIDFGSAQRPDPYRDFRSDYASRLLCRLAAGDGRDADRRGSVQGGSPGRYPAINLRGEMIASMSMEAVRRAASALLRKTRSISA